MKKYIFDFIRRGLIACGFGPIVFAIVYLIMQSKDIVYTVTVNEMCLGILSLAGLAFIAGGMNFVYQIERLPLTIAILIHGVVLYVSYLVTYLVNDWLEDGMTPILIFTTIFVFSYFIIWFIIYSVTKRNTDKVNQMLKKKQQIVEYSIK